MDLEAVIVPTQTTLLLADTLPEAKFKLVRVGGCLVGWVGGWVVRWEGGWLGGWVDGWKK